MWEGLMPTRSTRVALALVTAIFAVTTFAAAAKAQLESGGQTDALGPIQPLRPGITEGGVVAELEAHNDMRKSALQDYTALRTYQVTDLKGKVHAEEVGRMEFRAPDHKWFVTTSEKGSGMIRRMALNPLIDSEVQAAAGKEKRDSAISPANYSLELLGEQQVGSYHCFVARAIPKRKDKYLFEGNLWIDVTDYAVVRIEGHPAKNPSFWIRRADFVRQYQKIGRFWLPQRDETLVQVRVYGKKVLAIDHQDYVVNRAQNRGESVPGLEARARVTAGTN
jgi:hypothetical protein